MTALFDPSQYVRVRSGDLFHLARLGDRAGVVLCGHHLRHPSEVVDEVALPGQPLTLSAVLCAQCQRLTA